MTSAFRTWIQCKEALKRELSRTEEYGEGALEMMTQQCAKSDSRVSGSAQKHAGAVRRPQC